jgi:iron complex outermembrane receptor protein
MNRSITQRRARTARFRFASETTVSTFGALMLASGLARGADAGPAAPAANEGELETVVVTGIRAGLQDAITLKRENFSIVEAVSAEDIGKLPDTSIAESISRLPGLTSQRAEGRASAISLRGTDPGFTTALLNGREQVSTGDNRSIEFDQYPSELLSAVVVYKTPDAQLVGQGLAGTIDLRTTRPLEYGRQATVLNIRGELNSNDDLGADSDDMGFRASFSYIDQFLDDTLGVTFGYAHLDQPLATRGAGTYGPWHPNANPGLPTGYNQGIPASAFVTNGAKVRTDMGDNVRDGAMAALEWRPNDNFTSILDLYYTRREQEDNARSLEVNLSGYPGDGDLPDTTPVAFNGADPNLSIVNGNVVAGTLFNVVPLARNFLFKTQDKIMAAGWNNKFTSGNWTFVADVSYSKAKRNEQQYELNAQARSATPGNVYSTGFISVTQDNMPVLNFQQDMANPAIIQIGPTIYGAGYSKIPRVTDELTSARFDVGYALDNGWLSDVLFGANYADREKDKFQPEGGINTINGAWYQIDGSHLLAPTNLGYANANPTLAWDVEEALHTYYQPIVYGSPTTPGFDYLIGKNWTVNEKVGTAFVKGNLDHEISSTVTLRGNIGLQFVDTDQSSDAFKKDNTQPSGQQVVPFTDGKTYQDWLPAINLAFLLPGEQAVRVGLARELARARMDQLKASSEFAMSQFGEPSGSGGNPQLNPWRANAFDLSYEKYFGPNAYVSVAAFYKDLKSYIYNQTNGNYDFSDFVADLPDGYLPDGVTPRTTGNFSQPVNGQGGDLKGLEFSVSLTGESFTNALAGFGAILSYSYTESGIRIQDPPGNNFLTGNGLGEIPLPGLSENVWNATLYYENAGFSARVATRARSKYIGEVTNFANDRALKYVQGDQITDAQIGYEFGPGRLEGLSILFQVNNLTNEPYIAYALDETRQQDYQEYGRQYLLGINYRL